MPIELKVDKENNIVVELSGEAKSYQVTVEEIDDPVEAMYAKAEEKLGVEAVASARGDYGKSFQEELGKPLGKIERPTLSAVSASVDAEKPAQIEVSGGTPGIHYYRVKCGPHSFTCPIVVEKV